jgi:demethylmenaquinone methyltransferase/2-methoxy-6-polyprenyl-1,4-benzoquinol methylase
MAGWVTGQRDAYEYLGGSIEAFPAGKAMTTLMETCGFAETEVTPLTFGVVSIYQGTRPTP